MCTAQKVKFSVRRNKDSFHSDENHDDFGILIL